MKSTIELKTETFENLDYTFDWNDLPDEAKFVAVDDDGLVCWYSRKPKMYKGAQAHDGWWYISGNDWDMIEELGLRILNWEDTLIERPTPVYGFKHVCDLDVSRLVNRSYGNPKANKPKYEIEDRFAVETSDEKVVIIMVTNILKTEDGFVYKLSCDALRWTKEQYLDSLNKVVRVVKQ